MPDTRTTRGPHPKDHDCFAEESLVVLRAAVADLSWLLTRGYSDKASLKIVGDRHSLRDRQRQALGRCAASAESCTRRKEHEVSAGALRDRTVSVDGYNVLLSIEAALCDAVLLLGRDGTLRDLAAMSRHYRRVQATRTAVELLADFFAATGIAKVVWYLDRPVSNSGRLGKLIEEIVAGSKPPWQVELIDHVDRTLAESPHIVATADSAILDRCHRWVNLARRVIERSVPDAWIIDLRG